MHAQIADATTALYMLHTPENFQAVAFLKQLNVNMC